ncbi:MAG TPA: peptidoglycan-binding domain-containing protein [Burkholderiales bacterium]|nr:peptidoglycan-binding domain-containing protein [Burkholderiales bacterium]
MKLRPLVATVIGSALLSAGAYAASDSATQQRKSQTDQDRSMSQSQGMQQDKTQPQQRAQQDTVRKAQQALKDKGFDAGPVDGIMGPKTQQAIKKFQESQANLKESGQLDQQTLSALGVEGQDSAAMGATSGSPRGAGAPPAAGAPSAGGPGGAKQPDRQPSR